MTWVRGRSYSEDFRSQQVLAPPLLPGEIVVMDNLAAHKIAPVREAIAAAGIRLRKASLEDRARHLLDAVASDALAGKFPSICGIAQVLHFRHGIAAGMR